MTKSELHRLLLYKGYDDVADYLHNNPFNRCVYNVLLNYGPKQLPVSMRAIFNEIYYHCVRINFFSNGGINLAESFVKEESLFLGSSEGAKIVLNMVWGLLSCKDVKTYHEKCFVDQFYPFIEKQEYNNLAFALISFSDQKHILPPRELKPMPIPIDEMPMIVSNDDCMAWRKVTDNFSQKTIEGILGLYGTSEEQVQLLSFIEGAFRMVGDETCKVDFSKVRESIIDRVTHSVIKQDVGCTEDSVMRYRKQLEALQRKYKELESSSEQRVIDMESRHLAELQDLRKLLENKPLLCCHNDDQKMLFFSFTEMVEYVNARFSKTAAEEFAIMLYNLVIKHGSLNEDICKAIDLIIPTVQQRESGNTTIQIPSAQQVNINPQSVNNHVKESL